MQIKMQLEFFNDTNTRVSQLESLKTCRMSKLQDVKKMPKLQALLYY